MDAAWKRAIRLHHPKLRAGVIVKNFLPSLHVHSDAGGFLTDVESETISSKGDNIKQVDELVAVLLTKEDEAFDSFCRILKENGYPTWSEKLSRSARQDAPGGAVCSIAEARPLFHSIMDDYLKVRDAFCDSSGKPSLDVLKSRCYDLIDVAFADEPRINRQEHALQNAVTIQEFARILFFRLSRWISFDFLDKVIKHFQPELQDVKEQLDQYKEKLQLILVQKLKEIGEVQQQEQEEASDGLELTEIVAKYRLDADGLRVQDLVTERDFLAQRLGIPKHLLQVLSWRPGSIVIVFLILQELQPLVEPTLRRSDVRATLARHGVVTINLCRHSSHSSHLSGNAEGQRQWSEPVLKVEPQKVVRHYFGRIVKDLDVRAISGDLFAAEVLDFDLKQEVDSKETNKAANTVLANYLHQNADMAKLEGFLEVLESDVAHPKHKTLAKDMREYQALLLSGDAEGKRQWSEPVLKVKNQKVVRRYFGRIVKDLDVRAISRDLFAAEVLDFDLKLAIDSKDTNKAANTMLASYLHQNADRAKLEGFLKVLESDLAHPKHRALAKDMREYLAQSLSKQKDISEQVQTPSQQNRSQPVKCTPLEQGSKNDVNKQSDGQSGYLLKHSFVDNRHLDHLIPECPPDSLEEQDNRPQVECMDLDSSQNVELPFIDDEAVPEDDLHDNEAEKRSPEQLEMKVATQGDPRMMSGGRSIEETSRDSRKTSSSRGAPTTMAPPPGTHGHATMLEPSSDIASSLNVVCYPCLCELDVWRCIKVTGSCKDSSHEKTYCVWYKGFPYPIREATSDSILTKLCNKGFNCPSGLECEYAHCDEELSYWRDPSVLPPCEMCKDCRWRYCITLFKCLCWTQTHDESDEVVVYKDEQHKDLVEIRCPWNYLGMRNKEYRCDHTLEECRHCPTYTCGFPHTEVEQDIWNKWKRTASANASNRTARRFLAEIKEVYQTLVHREITAPVSHKPKSSSGITQPTRPRSRETTGSEPKPYQPLARKSSQLLTAPLTLANYRDKFLLLNERETEEHVRALERCNGTFAFQEYQYSSQFDRWPHSHQWYGSLEVPQYLGDHVRQAATHVELEKEGAGWRLTGDIISTQKFLNGKYILLVGFNTGRKPQEVSQQREGHCPTLMVVAVFCLKYRYFENLHNAIQGLPNAVIPKLMLEQPPKPPSPIKSLDELECLPSGFELDEEYQGPTCQQLLQSSPDFPFLITGPFGTGKTRVIAAACYSILKQDPQSRILIATHHRRTADVFVESYFTEGLVEREGLEVVRMVSKDTLPGILSGLIKVPWMVKDTLHNFQLIITTFVLSMGLSQRLKPGHFTHIFIDEAAQAREPETIAAFSLAGRDTKIIIAGDHMQVGPKTNVLGKVPRENGLSDSLLVRLRNLYRELPGVVSKAHQSELLINYRCHPAIVRLPSRLFYDCRVQTRAKSAPHPDWEKMVYFVCSSFGLRAPAAGDKWSTQKELLAEAKLEVQELKRIVQEYISGLSPKGRTTSAGKATSTLSSVCVMFPTRMTETLWKREVHHSPELRQVTCAVAYDIQGREFDAIFVCTAQPVNEDYSPFDSVKSMCDPYMFNTIITRPKSLLVAIGNPLRLRKIEQQTPDPPACWLEYLYQCWEGGSLLLSARLREDPGAFKKQLGKLEAVMILRAANKLHRVVPKACWKDKDRDGKKEGIMTDHSDGSKGNAVQNDGWKLGEEKQVVVVKDEQVSGLRPQCTLDGYTAIPTNPAQKPIVIPSIDERRCAFEGATVLMEETEQPVGGKRTGKVVSVIRQGPVNPMICTVDSHSPLILVPVDGKNPKIVNLPTRTREEKEHKPTQETSVEAVVNCYSQEYPTISVHAIPFKAAHDTFFIVQPLEWSVQERYPVGAVVGVLPKCPPLQLSEEVVAVQHKVSQSPSITPDTASNQAVMAPLSSSTKIQFKKATGIEDSSGRCSFTFSVEAKKNHFIVAVHVSNVADLVSEMEDFKKRFSESSVSHVALSQHVIQRCDFSEVSIQKAISVEFKVEEPVPMLDTATRRNMLLTQLSVKTVLIREAMVQCSTILAISDVEDILWSLQKGRAADRKLSRGKKLCLHDALAILYCTAEHLHKTRHGHVGYPLLEMASYEFPETEKMVNELLTLANSEVAKMIAKAFPDRALMVTQTMPDHSKEEIAKEFASSLALLPANYLWLTTQSSAMPHPMRPFVIFTDKLEALAESLKRVDFLEACQLLYFLHYHPQFTLLQEAIKSSFTPEHFGVGGSPTDCLRHVPYTSITNPFRCVGDVYVQEQLLAAVRGEDPPRSIEEVKEVAMHFNQAKLNAKDYESARSKLKWAHFAQNSSICVQSIVRSMKGGKLHLCCQYDQHGNMQENITVPVLGSNKGLHADYTAIVTSLTGPCQVTTRSKYQGGSDSISVTAFGKGGEVLGDGSCSLLMTPQTVQVPADTLRTVVDCINTFDEEKAAKSLKLLQQLEKQEHKSPKRRGPPAEPDVQDSHFLLLECPLPLSPHQVVDVWMRMDTSQFIATPQPQLLEIGHSNVRVCLHHTEQPEACFTSGSTVQAPQQVHSSVESYVSEWEEVVLAEAACRSVGRKRHILINRVRIWFDAFEALDVCASEQFYRPVGEVTVFLPSAFMEDRQDIFPLEQGDLVCARYVVDLMEDESGLELLERHGNCFPPQHEPVGRLVLHMVVERVEVMVMEEEEEEEGEGEEEEEEGTQHEVMMSQEVVQSGVELYLRVVGEQGAHISPLMRDLLITNTHPCQMEVVPMEPNMRSVYQSLRRLPTAATKLAVDIMLGDLKAFQTARVMEHPTFDELMDECLNVEQMHESVQQLSVGQRVALERAYQRQFQVIQGPSVPDRSSFAELEKEYPKVTHLWYKSSRKRLNAGQRAAVEKAYQSRFHIIQGPPGTEKLVVAVHLAYAFAHKNKQMGVRKCHCVLLCAPDDAAVDTTLSLLRIVAGSSEKDIRLLRIYSREVERHHCPGPYQDTNVFEVTATVDYRVPQEMEKFALHNLICSKMEEKCQYSGTEMPSPAQRSKYRQSVAEAERQVIQEGQFDVVLCTCSEASSARVQRHFTPFQCIVYEASLATEPETVAAIARSSHQVVLIGDHSSVRPPVCSQRAGLAGLGVSLFERYARQLMEDDEYGLYSFLEEQYRMVEPLCDFPSHEFYNGQLKTSPTLNLYRYPELDLFWPKGNRQPLVFCNVRGREETDQLKSAEDAIVNRVEAEKVVDIVQKVVTALSGGKGKLAKETLAVLTTTEAQQSLIQGLLLQTDMDKTVMGLVRSQVMTISASRGAKANIVILSTTRSCPAGAIPKDRTALLDHQWKEEHLGLLCQPHHTCLALTTGKHGLVIVGDMDLLILDDKWCHLVKHCSDKGCLVEGNAFPSEQFIEGHPIHPYI